MKSEYIDDLEGLNVHNFWFRAKERYLDSIIKKPNSLILDVGCGTGRNMASFVARRHEVIGIDINKRAVTLCKEKGYKVFQADLQKEAINDIQTAPDYITALDFMEHLEKPVEVLQNLKKISTPDTQLIITVPSYQFLFSDWDKEMGHVKRYTCKMLCNELEKGGWQISRTTYIHFIPLIPAILIRKIIKPVMKLFRSRNSNIKEKFFSPILLFDQLLYFLYYPEFLCFRIQLRLPLGLSILAIAKPSKFEGIKSGFRLTGLP